MDGLTRNENAGIVATMLALGALGVSSWFLSLWLFGSDAWVEWVSVSMKINTALALMSISTSIVFYAIKSRPPAAVLLGRAFGFLALLIGLATLAEYLFEVNFGIDELIHLDPAQDESIHFPGRMAPNAALSFFIFGLGLYWIDWRNRFGKYISDYLFAIVAFMAGIAIIGYVYQYVPLYQFSQYLRISQYTAILLLLLAIAGFFTRTEHPAIKLFLAGGPEGQLIRKMLPAAILFPIVILGLTARMRDLEAISRPTGYALAAASLVIIFSFLAWQSARAVAFSERERRRIFDQERTTWATINEVGQSLVAELNLEKLVQSVTDAATRLSGAQFGAFFYSIKNERGESLELYTISGVPREMFSKFPMPRSTKVFEPTFLAIGTVRSEDITKDPRYGHNAPNKGMPAGHLPVRSYLAVPVVSRGGTPIGGLFFGHERPGVFTEQSEKIVEGLAVQAAVAMDNAGLYKKLQESVRVRDEFLSIASHELKTPLTTLKLQAQMRNRFLKKGETDKFSPENLFKMVNSDNHQIDRIVRLVDDMLDIGRINSGKLTLNLEPFDLCELGSEIAERFKTQYQAAKVDLAFDCQGQVLVKADRHRIEQVIVNLLSNALKYGDDKPVKGVIRRLNGCAVIEVADQGIGIAEEHHERIFGRFERAVDGGGISGLGLGLFIVKQILDMHEGHIKVESRPGQGSKFVVDIPLYSES